MRRRGFTIVEVSIVIFMIILLTSIVAPSLHSLQRSQSDIGFRQNFESVAQVARSQAMRQNRATVLKFNNDGQIGWDFLEDPATEQQQTQDDNANIQLGEVRNGVSPTDETTFDTYQLNNEDVQQSEWQVGFYPDGTADNAVLQFTMGDQTFLFSVNPQSGSTTVRQGTIDDQTEYEWPAGEIEQRVG
ncbi:MAG: Tfp pilus assembly protein FimT/FimU [Fimbriimonadaceae bacterium]